MPDEKLFALARTGQLRDPETLRRQVNSMLDDPRAMSLGTVFAAQWLGSQHLGTRIRLDPIDNPWCTDSLMKSMREETALFFHDLVKLDANIERLINADFTYLNEELARHYQISGVKGQAMRKVRLKDQRRGGIFGQASLLAVTSFPYRTSPVVRGKWILETVLGTPPPPPPPNASELSEEIESNEKLSIREKLERHRSSPNCYACHSQMDPLGLSLERYDWFGRYRTRMQRRSIDDSGKLPDGTRFEGLDGLKQVILEKRRDDLTRQLTSKLLSYALGRQLEYFDEPAIRKIISDAAKDDVSMRELIQGIVKSYPFQYKKVAAEREQRPTSREERNSQ